MKTLKKSVFLLLLSMSTQLLFAQAEKSFTQLKWITTTNDVQYEDSRFGYDAKSFTPVLKRLEMLPKDDVCYLAENDEDLSLLGRYKNDSMREPVNILYTPGPSADPYFIITDNQNKVLWEDTADEMCINNQGVIYIAGHSNKMFNERRKLQLVNGKVKEFKQPYLYVGFKGKSLKAMKLYSEKSGGEVIATIPKGYEIEVLLSESTWEKDEYDIGFPLNYLARTSFGLVGWLRLTQEDTFESPVLQELRYWGD